MTNDTEHFLMCYLVIYMPFFVMSFKFFCSFFLIRLFVFLTFNYSYLYILNTSPLLEKLSENILSVSLVSLLIFLMYLDDEY